MGKNVILKGIADILIRLANIIFFILFIYIFVAVLTNTSMVIPASFEKYVIILLGWLAILCSGYFLTKRLVGSNKWKLLILGVLLGIQIVYVWAVHSKVDSDAYVINYIAYNFAQGNMAALDGFWREYLAVYTNNIPATAVITSLYCLWLPNTLEESWLFLSIIAALLSDVALVYIYKLLKVLIDERAAMLALIIAIPMISLSEPSTILYSDIMALWTTPAALYAIVQFFKSRQNKYLVMAGSVLAFGAWIKVQSIVVTIAICIVLLLGIMKNGKYKISMEKVVQGIIAVGCFLVLSLTLSGVTNKAIDIIGQEYVEENRMPALHFVAMGLCQESNGGYYLEDVNEMKSIPGQEAKKSICMDRILERLENMGPDGLIEHLNKKMILGLGRGTFTSGREWRGLLLNESLYAKRIQEWTIVHNPQYDQFTAVWIQLGYLLVMFTCLYDIKGAVIKRSDEKEGCTMFITDMCRIAMIGIVLMLLFLERNLRYMYAALPCMIVLCTCNLFEWLKRLRISVSKNKD